MAESIPRPNVPSPALVRSAGALLVVAVVVAYGNSVQAPFVFDDTLAIPDNPTIRSVWPLSHVLLPQADGGLTVSGRPLLNLTLALNYATSGVNPWSYHVFNILIHAGAALLLFGLVRRTWHRVAEVGMPGGMVAAGDGGTRNTPPAAYALPLAFVVAALWALHPLQTQAVTYTVQRAESLMGFFFLATLYAFVRAVDAAAPGARSVRRWLAVSVASAVAGMATKEVMATAPLLVLLYDRTFVAGSFSAAFRTRRNYYLALGATWLVLAALVLSTGGNRGGTAGFDVGVPLWAYPLTQFQAVARYLGLGFWPQPLVFEYGTFWVQRAADIAPYLVMVVPVLAATMVALAAQPSRPGWRTAGFLGAWFFGALAPTSLTPGTIQMIVEHRMYLPLAALVTAVAVGAHQLAGRRALLGLLVAAVAAGALAARRNHDYRSHLALWSDTVAKRPANDRAHAALADAWAEAGRFDHAIAADQEAVRLRPDEPTYHHNLGLNFAGAGRFEPAVRAYEAALRLKPDEAKTHNNLAFALGRLGRSDEMLRHYREAVRLRPAVPMFHYNLGVALAATGHPTEAISEYETVLRLDPRHADAHENLGAALASGRRYDAACEHYAAAVQAKPTDLALRTTYGQALVLARRPADALAQFQTVLTAQPESEAAQLGQANALSAAGQLDQAIAQYRALLQRAPGNPHAHFKLGNALLDRDDLPGAIEHYRRAVELDPGYAEAHHNLGIVYARLERWTEAQRGFETALRLQPDYEEARRHLEQLRQVLGETGK